MAAILQFRLTGGTSNSDPNASLGGVSSSNQVSATAMNNLFDNVSAAEAAAGDTEYRAIDIYNAGDADAVGVEIYMKTPTSSADSQLDMGSEASPLNSATSVANESASPDLTGGSAFANRTSGSPLSLPDIPAGEYARVWLRRVIAAAAGNTANDQGTIEVVYA